MGLECIFYFVIATSILFYIALDGFDLGVGTLHILAKTDQQRRLHLNAIGPVWDGNEVWIVVVIGGLFAGFPESYATVLSAFYSLIMILIAGFIFRAAAIEFRSKRESVIWRRIWDFVFSIASILVAFILGLLLGNLIEGIPLNQAHDFVGTTADFFRPYSILVGITAVALCAMHGAIYLAMKLEKEDHPHVRRWIVPAIAMFIVCYLAVSVFTVVAMPHMTLFFRHNPVFSVIPICAFFAIFNIPRQIKKGYDGWAFIFSCISIALLISLYAFGTFPTLVASTLNPAENSLTIYNSASSHTTLVVLLTIVAIGIPLVLTYGFWVYRVFRGKVKLDKFSY
jgi:cytochrome bd ubiquinol oxidase subunit II